MLRHNKKRNSYIIYEQLLTLATTLAAKGVKNEANFVLAFIKENFSTNTEIGKELKLFESVLSKKEYDKDLASKILDETVAESRSISSEKINEEKTRLIEKINKYISYELFDIPVKEYKIMASAQLLLNESRGTFESTPEQRVKIKNNLIERMTEKEIVEESEKVDNLTFSLMVNKFNKRYAKLMNEDQKHILSAWTNYLITNNEKLMLEVMGQKLSKIKECLVKNSKTQKEAEYYPMLKEACDTISKYTPAVTEESVYEVMRYCDIVEDLQNNEK